MRIAPREYPGASFYAKSVNSRYGRKGRSSGGAGGAGAPPLPPPIITTESPKRSSGLRGGCGGREPPRYHQPLLQHYFYNNISQKYFTTIFYNYFLTTLIRPLNSLTNIIINNININFEFVQTLLLSNQIRCWEGGMGGGYPLPNHLIWLDNKLINIHSLIFTH